MLYKDCNTKSNQKYWYNKVFKFVCEIVEYSSPKKPLSVIWRPLHYRHLKTTEDAIGFDFEKLHSVTKVLTRNLNRVIDVTKYPVETAEYSNKDTVQLL